MDQVDNGGLEQGVEDGSEKIMSLLGLCNNKQFIKCLVVGRKSPIF